MLFIYVNPLNPHKNPVKIDTAIHFTDEQTEAEKTCPRLNSWEVTKNQILETEGLAPGSVLLISILISRTQHVAVGAEWAGVQRMGRDPTFCCSLAMQPGATPLPHTSQPYFAYLCHGRVGLPSSSKGWHFSGPRGRSGVWSGQLEPQPAIVCWARRTTGCGPGTARLSPLLSPGRKCPCLQEIQDKA